MGLGLSTQADPWYLRTRALNCSWGARQPMVGRGGACCVESSTLTGGSHPTAHQLDDSDAHVDSLCGISDVRFQPIPMIGRPPTAAHGVNNRTHGQVSCVKRDDPGDIEIDFWVAGFVGDFGVDGTVFAVFVVDSGVDEAVNLQQISVSEVMLGQWNWRFAFVLWVRG